jgi:type I restriction-modification system DNA methylase subunit
MMAEIANPKGQETVIDPCCGSGRMLLGAIKVTREEGQDPYCFGADIDKTCVKMCAINLFLYGIQGEVACMNSITNDFYFAYKLANPFQGGLTIIENKEDSIIWKMGSRKFIKEEKPTEKPIVTNFVEPNKSAEMVKLFQESLF